MQILVEVKFAVKKCGGYHSSFFLFYFNDKFHLSSFCRCLEPLMKNSHSFLIYYMKIWNWMT